jgi:NhaP-type Na+/H+ and K+/H+ antiporter
MWFLCIYVISLILCFIVIPLSVYLDKDTVLRSDAAKMFFVSIMPIMNIVVAIFFIVGVLESLKILKNISNFMSKPIYKPKGRSHSHNWTMD